MVDVVPLGSIEHPEVTHRLNVLGFHCPIPVAETKKALKNLTSGDVLEVWADDVETVHDMPMLLERLAHRLTSIEEQAGEYRFIIEVMG